MALVCREGKQEVVRGLPWVYDDGGREVAGFKGSAGDCACRAIAIVTGLPYRQVYDLINTVALGERRKVRSSAREGVYRATADAVIRGLGFVWIPCMGIGKGCTVHMREGELPRGRVMARLSRHWSAVVEGIVRDTHDPCRGGLRCVYGYWVDKTG